MDFTSSPYFSSPLKPTLKSKDKSQFQNLSVKIHKASSPPIPSSFEPLSSREKGSSTSNIKKDEHKKSKPIPERSYLVPAVISYDRDRKETLKMFVMDDDLNNREKEKKLK